MSKVTMLEKDQIFQEQQKRVQNFTDFFQFCAIKSIHFSEAQTCLQKM